MNLNTVDHEKYREQFSFLNAVMVEEKPKRPILAGAYLAAAYDEMPQPERSLVFSYWMFHRSSALKEF